MPKAILASKPSVQQVFPQTTPSKKAKTHHDRPLAALYCRVSTAGQEEGGKRARMQDGKIHNFGAELYGYRCDKDRGVREVYEPEAAIIRALFHWYTEEKLSVRSIVKRLNGQEVPPPSISKRLSQDPDSHPHWGKGQIHRILREPAYKGLTISWRYDKVGRLKLETEWLSLPEGVTPALVNRDLWEAAQQQRASNTGAETRNQARPYLLRGMVVCVVCGWSSSNKRVLRQEETTHGHHQALGRHLGYRAGAE